MVAAAPRRIAAVIGAQDQQIVFFQELDQLG
jgi:hypothetical protein